MKVTHSISPNNMTTKLDGIRMRFSNGQYGGIPPITLGTLQNLTNNFSQPMVINPSKYVTAVITPGIFQLAAVTPGATSVSCYVSGSADKITWGSWIAATPGQTDACPNLRYELIKIVFYDTGTIAAGNLTTPLVYSVNLNWYTGSGQQKWSSNINFYLTDSNGIQDLQQQIGDSLGGDSQIINDVAVTAAPLILDTTDAASTQWQATAGSLSAGTYSPGPPPSWVGTYTASATAANVSASAPLIVAVGTVSFICVVEGGMNIANMNSTPVGFSAGATITNGCINLTSGTAVGSAYISFISPTTPVLTLVITTAGTITNLLLSDYGYTNLNTPYMSIANDQQSINRYKRRHQDIENDYVQNSVMTGTIAARVISNQKNPIEYIPSFKIFPPVVNMQPGDRVNVTDEITGIADDYYVVSFSRKASVSEGQASVSMTAILSEVPIA